jgi:hypothetical protein
MQTTPAPAKFGVEQRWSAALKAEGHTPVANYFLGCYSRLKPYSLTTGEAMFVVHLMHYKWGADAPFPSYATLAKRMGVSVKSVRRFAASLQQKNYLRREMRIGSTNLFHLGGLIQALETQLARDRAPAVAPVNKPRKKR